MAKRLGQNYGIRYSEAFKIVVVREVEENDLPFAHVQRKYGIRDARRCRAGFASMEKAVEE